MCRWGKLNVNVPKNNGVGFTDGCRISVMQCLLIKDSQQWRYLIQVRHFEEILERNFDILEIIENIFQNYPPVHFFKEVTVYCKFISFTFFTILLDL